MARAIRSRGYELQVLSVKTVGNEVLVTTAWAEPGGKRGLGPQCGTLVHFEAGEVLSIVETA